MHYAIPLTTQFIRPEVDSKKLILVIFIRYRGDYQPPHHVESGVEVHHGNG